MSDKQKDVLILGSFIGLVIGVLFITPYLKGGKNENLIGPAKSIADAMGLIQEAILQ